MNGIAWLVTPPTVIPAQGRIIKLIDLPSGETGRPSTGHKDYNFNRDYYLRNKEDILAKRRAVRAANRLKALDKEMHNRIKYRAERRADDAKRRAAAKAEREHAAVLRDSGSVQSV